MKIEDLTSERCKYVPTCTYYFQINILITGNILTDEGTT